MFGDQFRTAFARDVEGHVGTLDLVLSAAVTVVAAVVLLVPVDEPTLLRAVVGLPLLLFLPGYALAAALFPARKVASRDRTTAVLQAGQRAVSTVERLVISVVASVAVVGAAGIVANAVVGVTLLPILVLVVAFTLAATAVAYVQRLRLPEARQFAPLSSLASPTGPTLPATATGWFLLAAAVLALLVVGASGVAALGPGGDGVTEIYVGGVSENGTVEMGSQPTNVTAGESVTHYLVVEQRQATASNYTLVARLADGTNGSGSAIEIGRYDLTVDASGNAVQAVEISSDAVGESARVEYFLYEGEAPETPSRQTALRSLGVDLTVREG